jgi:hypothetical protein
MAAYVQWALANPGTARQLEQVASSAVYMVCNPNSLLQMEAGYATSHMLSLLHATIGLPASPSSDEETDTTVPASVSLRSWSVARKSTLALAIVKVLQCVGELATRAAARRWKINGAAVSYVLIIEVVKMVLRVVSSRRHVLRSLQRVRASCSQLMARSKLRKTPSTPRSAAAPLIVPVIMASPRNSQGEATMSGAVPLSSAAEWINAVRDVASSLRPVIYAFFALPHHNDRTALRAAWRVWLVAIAAETSLWLAQVVAGAAAPIVDRPEAAVAITATDNATIAALLQEEPSGDTLFGRIKSYAFREPFFGMFLRPSIETYVINGWVARNVPLFGALLSNMVTYVVRMQQMSFLYSSD